MKNLYYWSIVVVLLSIYSCATQGTPSGGRRDIKPPEVVTFSPANYSTNFSAKTIEITFNELIKFKDLRKELIVSPPLDIVEKIKPSFTPSKKIVIDLSKETLLPNTTYTINFGNAVGDNNEGNVLPNFKYVFSTGGSIDSLFVGGIVGDAFEEKFDPKTSILLYKVDSTFTDSTIYKTRPTYFTRLANERDSTFRIDNISPGEYHLVALVDENSNMRYDPLKEKIAFFPRNITLNQGDTTRIGYKLRLSKAEPPFKLYQGVNAQKGLIQIPLAGVTPDVTIERIFPTKDEAKKDFYIYSKSKDSLQYWFTEDISDSIVFVAKRGDISKDTMTSKIRKTPEVKFSINLASSNIELSEDVIINTNKPISRIDTSFIEVLNKDSIPHTYTVEIDSSSMKSLKITFKKSPDASYMLRVYPQAVIDIFDNSVKDTIRRTFKMKKEEDYGNMRITPSSFKDSNVIFQLLSADGKKVIREHIKMDGSDIVLSLLTPGRYKLRAIFDANANGKWDPADYMKHIQPERILYFNEPIEIKAFWDIEQEW